MKRLSKSLLAVILLVACVFTSVTISEAKTKKYPYIFVQDNPGIYYLTDGQKKTITVKEMLAFHINAFKNVTKKAKYEVKNPKVCSVKKGVITAKKNGTTTVKISYDGVSTSIKVNVGNSNFVEDAKKYLEESDATHFALLDMDASDRFPWIITCKVSPEDNQYNTYGYSKYYFTKESKKGIYKFTTPKALTSKCYMDGLPAIDYSKKMGLFYLMGYTKAFKNSPLKPESINFVEVVTAGYSELVKEKGIGSYTGDLVRFGITTEPKDKRVPVNFMGQTYYLYENKLEKFNEIYSDASTLVLVENTAENRDKYIN